MFREGDLVNENTYVLWLSHSLNNNNKKIYSILENTKSIQAVFDLPEYELRDVPGIKPKDIQNIINGQNLLDKWIYENKKAGVRFVSIFDNEYPALLKEIYEPPVGIYVTGNLPDENDICVSIIGARRCSEYGAQTAYFLSKEAAAQGYTIVSGLARGIDSMSHNGAIAANGKTIAVLGFGHNICYPAENRGLMDKIRENGCIISEYPPDTKPVDYMFRQRNRIIAGLSKGIIVVEAARKSGTLSTVDFALDAGRTVMAVPSNITSKLGEGTNDLIKQGCPLISSVEDIVLELGKVEKEETYIKEEIADDYSYNLSPEEMKVFSCIGKEAVGIEYIKTKAGITLQEVQSILTMLEIEGLITKLPGERYIKAI